LEQVGAGKIDLRDWPRSAPFVAERSARKTIGQ
jgi:hypothetical protein